MILAVDLSLLITVSALDEDLGLVGLNLSSYDKDNEDSNSVCSSLSTSFPSFGKQQSTVVFLILQYVCVFVQFFS